MQLDLLHKIENEHFNAVEGYYLAKELHDLRVERRNIKNELHNIGDLRSCIHSLRKGLTTFANTLSKLEEKQNNPIYKPRINEHVKKAERNPTFENMIRDLKKEQIERKRFKYA